MMVMALASHRALRELGLQLGRVQEDQSGEIVRPRGRVNRAVEAARDEVRVCLRSREGTAIP